MNQRFIRTQMLIGQEKLNILKSSHVAVFGLGGVGSYTAEALARSAVGKLSLFDCDVISESNINRQIIALSDTIGTCKVYAVRDRIAQINPCAEIFCHNLFVDSKSITNINFSKFDYIIDAIDTISAKILIAQTAYLNGIPIISCMSTGNKLDPSKFIIDDIYNTSVCPIARIMRRELRQRKVEKLKVLYSSEPPVVQAQPNLATSENLQKSHVPASISFVPPVAGLMLAGEAIRNLAGI